MVFSLTASDSAAKSNLVIICDCWVNFLVVESKWSEDSDHSENGQGFLSLVFCSLRCSQY